MKTVTEKNKQEKKNRNQNTENKDKKEEKKLKWRVDQKEGEKLLDTKNTDKERNNNF